MAQKERPEDGPSLEMPSLGSLFKRGRKQHPETKDDAPSAEDFERLVRGESTTAPPASDVEETTVIPTAADIVDAPSAPKTSSTPAPSTSPAAEVVDVPRAELPDEPDAPDPSDREPAPTPAATPGPRRENPAPSMPAPAASGNESRTALPEHDLIVAEEEADLADLEDDDLDFHEEPTEPAARRTLGDFRLPALPGTVASGITGGIVGVLAVALTYFSLQGCEAVKGTSACGGPGIPILIAIMVALVAAGSVLLAAWQITDPTSTSFLAVGLLAVIALLFLINVIFSPAMIVVIPLVSVGTYLLSHFVTSRFIEDA